MWCTLLSKFPLTSPYYCLWSIHFGNSDVLHCTITHIFLCTEITKFPLRFFIFHFVSHTLEITIKWSLLLFIIPTYWTWSVILLLSILGKSEGLIKSLLSVHDCNLWYIYIAQVLDLVFSNISDYMVYMYCIRNTFKSFLIWFSVFRYNSHSVRLCTDTVATDFGIICQLENGQKSMSTITRRPVGKSL